MEIKNELQDIFGRLDRFIEQYNQEASQEGTLALSKQTIHIVGQVALLLANLPFPISSTMDLDTIDKLPFVVHKELGRLLLKEGLSLEQDGHLIWMPEDTSYHKIFDFKWVSVLYADPQNIIQSKSKFNRPKDKALLEQFARYFKTGDKNA